MASEGCSVGWGDWSIGRGRRFRRGFGVEVSREGVVVKLVLKVFGGNGTSFFIWDVWLVVRYRGGWDVFGHFGWILSQILTFFVAGCLEVIIDLGISLQGTGGSLVRSSSGGFVSFRHGRFVKKFNY